MSYWGWLENATGKLGLAIGNPLYTASTLYDSSGNELGGAARPFTVGDFYHDVSSGAIDGHSILHKFGRNPDIDTASGFEAIWNGGGVYTGFNATGAEIITLQGGVNDVLTTGTGAWTVQVWGLSATGVEQTEVISMNGTTLVDSTLSYWRMDRMRVITAGSLGWNDAAITCAQKVTTAVIFAIMPPTYNSTMIAAATIPLAKTGRMTSWFAGLSGKTIANCNVRIRARPFGQVFNVEEEISVMGAGSSLSPRLYPLPKGPFNALTDIFIEADTDSNNTGFSAGFDMTLVEDGF